jgi:hypothetical protein
MCLEVFRARMPFRDVPAFSVQKILISYNTIVPVRGNIPWHLLKPQYHVHT